MNDTGLARDTQGQLQAATSSIEAFRKKMLDGMKAAGADTSEVERRFSLSAEERAAEDAVAEEQYRRTLFNWPACRRKRSGLEGDQLRNTFQSYRTDSEETRLAAKRAAVRFAHEAKTGQRKKGLHFYGRPGRGKDHLLHAITIELAEAGVDVFYGYSLGIKHTMLEEWQRHSDPETAIEQRMSECKVLCIGDLHKVLLVRSMEGVRDREVREAFTRVINRASSVGSPILCISGNIDPKDYASREFGGYDDPDNAGNDIDGAIYSRLQGCTIPIEVRGQDMRQEAR